MHFDFYKILYRFNIAKTTMYIVALVMLTLSIRAEDPYHRHYEDHHCSRECNDDGAICNYKFVIEWRHPMEPSCQRCAGKSPDQCVLESCILADGRDRQVTAVNRRIPGPPVYVCAGDKVIIDIENQLIDATTSMHVHGLRQPNTTWYDGVPMLTQCPILPATSFQYEYLVTEPGTYFYHSHSGFQRSNGFFGAFVVRPSKCADANNDHYDYDLKEHVILLNEWPYTSVFDEYTTMESMNRVKKHVISTILVNGVGSNVTNDIPMQMFEVKKGRRYRFRVIHAGGDNCPIKVNVQDHPLVIIATDANEVEPITVDSFYIYSGERIDFVLNANQPAKHYWMKFLGLLNCEYKEGIALIRYENSTAEPPAKTCVQLTARGEKRLGCHNITDPNAECRNYAQMKARTRMEERLKLCPEYKYIVSYGAYYPRDQDGQPDESSEVHVFAINNISHIPPTKNIYQGLSNEHLCNRENNVHCNLVRGFCSCTHYLEIPGNKTVELILINDVADPNFAHPMHLHGYSFRVLAMDRVCDVSRLSPDIFGRVYKHRNLNDPPLKDTLVAPWGGYAIVRFITDSSGIWAFHSLNEIESRKGMFMMFKTGDLLDPPRNFPTCSSFKAQDNFA